MRISSPDLLKVLRSSTTLSKLLQSKFCEFLPHKNHKSVAENFSIVSVSYGTKRPSISYDEYVSDADFNLPLC